MELMLNSIFTSRGYHIRAKKAILLGILAVTVQGLSAISLAQGYVVIQNSGQGWNARVSHGVTGAYLEGNAWLGQVYYVMPGTSPSESGFLPIPGPAATFATGFQSGIFDGISQNLVREVPDLPPGTAFLAEFRVWNAEAGTTFEEAASNPGAVVGRSIVGTGAAGTAQQPGNLEGFAPFSVYPVSEPSAFFLTLLGSALMAAMAVRNRVPMPNDRKTGPRLQGVGP
jgi:hypothetical protein